MAENGPAFIGEVQDRLGIDLEIVDRETEAHLAAAGCYTLVDRNADAALLFDIGGGSSEIVWMGRGKGASQHDLRDRVRSWASLQLGVVTLAEKFGGVDVDDACYEDMVAHVAGELADFISRTRAETRCSRFHLLGTSGTVTTIAGVHLGLARYDRRRVDGLWMTDREVERAIRQLRGMSYEQRVANGCIGAERADLVLAGCAIFDAIRRAFPAQRIRIADRGLREGILMQLMTADQAWGSDQRGQGNPG
jgi:exopolyphosphatase/guanosine-5'-triphosphate,3'-diphosphate pyrophosphatase